MKKIILSVAVAAMALTTTASALEDIKVNGQAKLWYETQDAAKRGSATDTSRELFNQAGSSGEVAFKLGMTGKQGNVGFGATVYQTSTMGLETSIVSAGRTNTNGVVAGNGEMFTSEAYVTAPMGASTTLKFGKQELNTPLAFTEKWNAVPNTFNAAVAINQSIDNLTLIGAYVGQDNATNWKVDGEVTSGYLSNYGLPHPGATVALAGLYKTDALAVNAWYYGLEGVATAIWVDAGVKVAGMDVKGYFATISPSDAAKAAGYADASTAMAASVATKVSGISVFGAFSMVGDDAGIAIANTSTGGKKTKLPTAGVYTDGLYVAQMGSTAMKVKAVTKIGDTKLIAQFVNNTNSITANAALETTEIDVIAVTKVGDFNVKGIIMNRSFADSDTDTASGGLYVRAIVALNF